MAKYPQGVSSFIPQYQPYQVDFNYVNNMLAIKQDQYDRNWKAINKVYGQLYYADLTNPANIQKKEQLEKQIDFNLKRVAGLDLSLDQNATQALQIFKPFYEDKSLMYDMAFTKNAKMEKLTGESYRTATDEKIREQAWSEGIKAIDYRIDEFRNSPIDDIFSIPSPKYVPYQNVSKKAMAYAKELGIKVKDFGFTPDGRFIIEQQNGQPLVGPLYKMFMSAFGNDESIMDVYRTQAYVNRKDYMYANKDKLGSLEAAEAEYLNTKLQGYKAITQERYNLFKNQDNTYTKNIQSLERRIASGNKDPRVADQLENIRKAQQENQVLLAKYQKSIEVMDDGISRTANTQGGAPSKDINDLRYKVDFLEPSYMLEQDLRDAAESYATTTSERTIKTNQFKLQEERAAQARSLAILKDKLDTNRLILKYKLDSGEYDLVEQDNQKFLVPKKELNEVEPIKTEGGEGFTKQSNESQQEAQKKQEEVERTRNEQSVKSMFSTILQLHESGDMSDEEFFSITQDLGMSERWNRRHPTKEAFNFGFPSNSDSKNDRRRKLENYSSLDINDMSPFSIAEVTAGFKNWITKKNKLPEYQNNGNFQNVINNFNNIEDIGEGLIAKHDLKVKYAEETSRLLNKEYKTNLGKYLFDSDGNMRDDITITQMMVNDGLVVDADGNKIGVEGGNDNAYGTQNRAWLGTPKGLAAWTAAGASFGLMGGPFAEVTVPAGAFIAGVGYLGSSFGTALYDKIVQGDDPNVLAYVKGEKDGWEYNRSVKDALEFAKESFGDLQEKNMIKTPLYGYSNTGGGKFLTSSGRITVMPGAFGTDNFKRYSQLNNAFKNLSYTKDETRASVSGYSENDWNTATDEKLNSVTQSILKDLYEYSKNKKNKDNKFTLDFHPVANGSLNYSAVTIDIPEKIAEKYKMKYEGKENESGFLSSQVYDKLITNGLTLITKSSNFAGTDLYDKAFMDPVENRVRAQYAIDGTGVTYTNPYYDNYSISFTQLPSGDIEYKQTIPMWNPNTKSYVDVGASAVLSGQGLQLQKFRNNFWTQVAEMNEKNNP
jgi:hypothetical protein